MTKVPSEPVMSSLVLVIGELPNISCVCVCVCVYVCVCVCPPQAIKSYSHEMNQNNRSYCLTVMTHAINSIDEYGLSNETHHEFLPKKGKAMLY